MKFPIGSSIKWYRKEKRMTQKELAERVNLSEKTISSYENHLNEPDLLTLLTIANSFNVALSTLIEKAERMMNMRKSYFAIDSLDGIFEGYTTGDTWNGFACPCFEKEVALKIAEKSTENGEEAFYDKEKDCFVFRDSREEEAWDEYEGYDIVCDGKMIHVYAIGSYSWIWDEEQKQKA